MILPILKMGDPRLLQEAKPVARFDLPELHRLLEDMLDTMSAAQGVGLAAPQVGAGLQVVIFGFESSERYPDAPPVPFTVLVNPVLQALGEEMAEDWEGCLSIPGVRGMVPRYQHLRYRGFDQYGHELDRTVSGFHARVVQHECDHLMGILYPMRIVDMRKFGFNDVLPPGKSGADE